jgi:Zn-dependent protease with chaperone function
VDTPLFPHYTEEFLAEQEGLKGTALSAYNRFYEGARYISRGLVGAVKAVADLICRIGRAIFDGPLVSLRDRFYPINPMNAERHLAFVPRTIEKFLGDNIILLLGLSEYVVTSEKSTEKEQTLAQRVNEVTTKIIEDNRDLINPVSETPFDYRTYTVASIEMQAAAAPGGGIIVHSQLIKEIEGSIAGNEVTSSSIEFADGSKVIVDLSEVASDDIVALAVAHEISHAASRHTLMRMTASTVISATLKFFRINNSYVNRINNNLLHTFMNRQREYEADTAGLYLATRSGYNPLGAIYACELLRQKTAGLWSFHEAFELISGHPTPINRQRALIAAISEINPEALKDKVTFEPGPNRYVTGPNEGGMDAFDLLRSKLA